MQILLSENLGEFATINDIFDAKNTMFVRVTKSYNISWNFEQTSKVGG